jgi:hypothetical protein
MYYVTQIVLRETCTFCYAENIASGLKVQVYVGISKKVHLLNFWKAEEISHQKNNSKWILDPL